ncbi:DUF1410 domain-containing protein [Mycoplasmopsis felis]|uniref:DUF1410 domain-containing protein n=1 Tax=Mycoplasmopsis felis TaxID=33923 RepID=UPI002AFF48D4|nr:DUF1410 domain-containing protein [Mycoplasmopsis felis]WQQ05829.1 DUF1410 domain-containing protein [Mycoplasmopsis felis]
MKIKQQTKKKILSILMMCSSGVLASSIVSSCITDTNEEKKHQINSIRITNVTHNSAEIELGFLFVKTEQVPNLNIKLNDSSNLISHANYDNQSKTMLFRLNNLQENSTYVLEKIYDGTNEIDFSNISGNKSFTTLTNKDGDILTPNDNPSNPIQPNPNPTPLPKKESNYILSNFSVSNITHNSSLIKVAFSKFQNVNTTNFEFVFTNNKNNENLVITNPKVNTQGKLLEIQLNNLQENTTYTLNSLKINNEVIDLSSLQIKSFNTIRNNTNSDQSTPLVDNISNVNFGNITHKKVNVDVILNRSFESSDNLILELVNKSNNNTISYSNSTLTSSNTKTFNIVNLNPNTTYEIKNIILNGKNLTISSNITKTFTTNQEPQDSFVVSSIETTGTKNTQTYVKVNFSQHQLGDEDNKKFSLVINDQTYTTSSYNNEPYVLFFVSGLTRNTTYNISGLSINNKNVPLVGNKTFKTTDNDLEERRSASPTSEFQRTQPYPVSSSKNKYYDEPSNIQNKDYVLTQTTDYQNYLNSSNKTITYSNDSLDQYTKVPRVVNGSFNNENTALTVELEIPNPQNNTYTLEYEKTSDNNTKTTVTVSLNKTENKFNANITTTPGDVIKITKLLSNNQEVPKFNKAFNTYFETIVTGTKSNNFTFKHFKNWELLDANTLGTKWKLDPQIFTKDNSNSFPTFYWKYQKVDGTIDYAKFNTRNSTHQIKAEVEKNQYAKSLGIYYEENNKKYRVIDNTLLEPKIPNKNSSSVSKLIDINSINVSNNKVTVNFNKSVTQEQDLKVLVKSVNPLQPWSKIITLNKNGQSGTFETGQLQTNIKNYIITHSLLDNKESIYDLDSKYKFTKPLPFTEVVLNDFKVIGDEEKRILYGTSKFDITSSNIEYLKDKWFEFTFEAEVPEDKQETYNSYYVKNPKIIVPFDKLNKFILKGFIDRVKYKLTGVKVLEPYTTDVYVNVNFTKNSEQYNFVKYFNYDLYSEMLDNDTSVLNVQNSELITNKKNLTTTDLRNISLSSESKNSIPYSIQNMYSWINYKYELYYRNARDFNKHTVKNFKLIDENNQEIKLKSIVGRELLSNKKPVLNDTQTNASITKDLSKFNNLENLNDKDVLFNFIFELDPTHKVLSNSATTYQSAKTYVMVPVSYKKIKETRTIDNSVFNVVHGYDDFETSNLYHKILNTMFRFKVSLNNNDLKLEIIAKDEQNTKIFDFKPDHNLSLINSAFLGNHDFYVFYKETPNVELDFTEKAVGDNLIAGPNEKASYREGSGVHINNSYEPLFGKFSKLKDESKTSIRLFEENKSKVITDLRQRSFAFQSRDGTWLMLGKVKPNDNTDFRFYITSNEHVADNNNILSYKRDPNNPWVSRQAAHTDIKVPVIINQSQYNQNNTYPIVDSNNLRFGFFDINIEIINNFNNELFFPENNEFKDNQGNSLTGNLKNRTADLVYAIADFSFIFKNFAINNEDGWRWNGQTLTDTEKSVIKYIHNWVKLPMIKATNQTLVLDDYVNLNAYIATFPAILSDNKDSPAFPSGITNFAHQSTKRYREYLLGSSIRPLTDIFYLPKKSGDRAGSFSTNSVSYSTNTVDLGGGSSGTSLFDNEGNLLGYVVSGHNPDNNKETEETFQMFVIDQHAKSYFGNGTTPLGNTSFYERMRMLSYYYPEWFDPINFTNKPKHY